MAFRQVVWAGLVLTGAILCGCSGPKVDEKKPVAEIRTEAEKMTPAELRRVAEAYRKAIAERRETVDDLRDRLGDMKPEDLVNQGAATLKKDAETLATALAALDERLALYTDLYHRKPDPDKPLAEITAETEAMTAPQVRAIAEAWRDGIQKRRDEWAGYEKRLDELAASETAGREAARLRKDVDRLKGEDKALLERLDVLVKQLGAKGGDTAGLSLPAL